MADQHRQAAEKDAITFSIASRLMVCGDMVVVLHLYRGNRLARTSTLTVCGRQDLAPTLDKCRSHLRKLGIAEDGNAPRQLAPALTSAA